MNISERIKALGSFFKEMNIITSQGKQLIYVVVKFPNNWVIADDIAQKFDVSVTKGDIPTEYYFCAEMDGGEDRVFDAVEYNIAKMKEAIERAQLLAEKTKELKSLFEDESISIEELRSLTIYYESKKNCKTFDATGDFETLPKMELTPVAENKGAPESSKSNKKKKNPSSDKPSENFRDNCSLPIDNYTINLQEAIKTSKNPQEIQKVAEV